MVSSARESGSRGNRNVLTEGMELEDSARHEPLACIMRRVDFAHTAGVDRNPSLLEAVIVSIGSFDVRL